MSNEKLSPEIMEEIQKKFPIDLRESIFDRYERNAIQDRNELLFNAAIEGATIALTKQWVKVEDMLPEKDGDYMVSTSYKDVFQNIFKDGKWAIHMRDGSKITHWMPLPSPPQD